MISGLSQLGQDTAGMRSWTRQQAAPRFGTSSVEGGTTDADVTISAVVSDIRTRTGSDQGSGNLRKWTKSLAPAQQIPTPSILSEEYNFSHFYFLIKTNGEGGGSDWAGPCNLTLKLKPKRSFKFVPMIRIHWIRKIFLSLKICGSTDLYPTGKISTKTLKKKVCSLDTIIDFETSFKPS